MKIFISYRCENIQPDIWRTDFCHETTDWKCKWTVSPLTIVILIHRCFSWQNSLWFCKSLPATIFIYLYYIPIVCKWCWCKYSQTINVELEYQLSRCTTKPTKWSVHPGWSEFSLGARHFVGFSPTLGREKQGSKMDMMMMMMMSCGGLPVLSFSFFFLSLV